MSNKFRMYRKSGTVEIRDYDAEIDTDLDKRAGHPKPSGKIARDPNKHTDQWYISQEYFEKNYEEVG